MDEKTFAPGNETTRAQAPFERLGTYQLGRRLGKGGMGEVFEAVDTRLGRRVAIKFLRSDDSEQVARFLREARSQASVDHECLCKVFEVGEFEGRPHIVMQLIHGRTLAETAAHMSLEQKLWVMQKVAGALHAAHRAGLVHRDLKPGNIMLEQTDLGELKPYVLDFGLAQMGNAENLTVTGEILGTPGYMAPEQARGETNLDRRTDVYGLGATLFYLLLGKPPFSGSSPGSVLVDIMQQDPPRPRSWDTAIPRDVETMVMKCLSKERERRYESARALGEDLARFLDGEPIQARPASWLYRLAKKMRKHAMAVKVAAVAMLLVVLSLSWGTWRTATQTRLTRELTSQVKEIEALARHAHLARRHDIRPLYQNLNQRMKRMETHTKSAAGPANHALGWGHLVLGSPQQARQHLDIAWRSGYREPAVAYALGLTYSTLYRKHLLAAQRGEDALARTRLAEAARQQFRDPALFYMSQARHFEAASPHYLDALIAFCEGRFQDSLVFLETAQAQIPWFYEAHRLEADLYRTWALEESGNGRLETARAYFERALTAYEKAADIGQSDPENYRTAAKARLGMMTMDLFNPAEVFTHFSQGLAQLELGLTVLPEDGEALLLEAALRRYAAQKLQVEGFNPTEELAAAVGAAHVALASGVDPSAAHLELGALRWHWAKWLHQEKAPSQTMVNEAISALEKVAQAQRGYQFFFFLGSAYRNLAQSQARQGLDARAAYDCAIDAFRQAVDLRPQRVEAYNSLAICLYHLSSAKDAVSLQLLWEAADHLERAIAINPNHVVLHYQLGRTWLRLAQGGDPGMGKLDPILAEAALEQFKAGLALNPRIVNLYSVSGWARLLMAQHAWEQGLPPDSHFEAALEICRRGLEIAPHARSLNQHMATIHYFRGKYRLREGKNPEEDLVRAELPLKTVIEQAPGSEAYLLLGSVDRLRAEYRVLLNKDPTLELDRARQAFEFILKDNPKHGEALRSLGRLFTLEARWRLEQGSEPEPAFRRARQYLDRALVETPTSPYLLLAEARWFIQRATWSTLNPPDGERLTALIRALAQRTDLPEAQAALACLPQAGPGVPPKDRQALLDRALAANRHLTFEWGGLGPAKH